MKIKLLRHINHEKEGRIEFLFVDFPYIDGNELIAKYMKEIFDAKIKEQIDGMFYKVTKVEYDNIECFLVWHEDFGNYGYCIPQTEEYFMKFEKDLKKIFSLIQANNLLWAK